MKNKLKLMLANLISEFFNPIILAIIILLFGIYKSDMPQSIALGWYIGVLVLNFFIPGGIYLFFTNKGYIFDDSLKNEKVKRQRIILMMIFLLVTAFEILVLSNSEEIYQPLFAILVGGIIAIVLASVVSYFWKISLHSAMITMLVMMIICLYGYQYWPLVLTIPLVWWARIVLNRHTIFQLIAGFLFSVAVVFFTFSYFNLI